ncbi:transporter substrate-binding domain-containing protein [Alkalihalophilus lindianensis]|uniref:Transporter substrate-binding domain-containing protein n=1 Tax=Alkalihalophilus lindianensis TaxID=1630542 RepID=A0ABU3XF70_9BACI|nr:transporter substrate-binding domain-containing protein [Alkalihalophilus lindianensis]MDV2686546.1 transporter substrate-binding domain-containing protein [Alkalihalophilus lindianensis]
MKKLFYLLIVLMLMMMLAACGATDETEGDNGDTAETDAEETTDASDDTSWTEVEESGVLVVGTSGTYAPITFYNESNELTGFEVELVKEVAEKLDLEIEFSTMDFDGILPSLRNGQIDVAAHDFAITEERKETFDFLIPHKYSYGSIVVRAEDADRFESAYDLEGVDVALGSLTSNYAIFADNIGANGTAYDGGTEAILRDVINGNTEAYLNDHLVLQRTIDEFGDDRLVVADQVKYHATESAMAVLKGNGTLKEKLDEAVQELIDDGTVARLSEEFLGEDVSEPVDESEVVGLDGE